MTLKMVSQAEPGILEADRPGTHQPPFSVAAVGTQQASQNKLVMTVSRIGTQQSSHNKPVKILFRFETQQASKKIQTNLKYSIYRGTSPIRKRLPP